METPVGREGPEAATVLKEFTQLLPISACSCWFSRVRSLVKWETNIVL